MFVCLMRRYDAASKTLADSLDALRYNGSSILIDCGEGTQIAIKEKRVEF